MRNTPTKKAVTALVSKEIWCSKQNTTKINLCVNSGGAASVSNHIHVFIQLSTFLFDLIHQPKWPHMQWQMCNNEIQISNINLVTHSVGYAVLRLVLRIKPLKYYTFVSLSLFSTIEMCTHRYVIALSIRSIVIWK